MYTHNQTLYPMLGVGAFMSMFWAGIVVGHELGVGCVALLIMGLLSGCIATVGVCELQRRDGGGLGSRDQGTRTAALPVRGQPCRTWNRGTKPAGAGEPRYDDHTYACRTDRPALSS